MSLERAVGEAVLTLLRAQGASEQVVVETYNPKAIYVYDPGRPDNVLTVIRKCSQDVIPTLDNGSGDH